MPSSVMRSSTVPTVVRGEDRRMAVRKRVHLAARIRLSDSLYAAATVRDISPMGAGVELASEVMLPLRFRLQIPEDLFEVECELRHQNGRIIGVEFLSHRAEAMARYS